MMYDVKCMMSFIRNVPGFWNNFQPEEISHHTSHIIHKKAALSHGLSNLIKLKTYLVAGTGLAFLMLSMYFCCISCIFLFLASASALA